MRNVLLIFPFMFWGRYGYQWDNYETNKHSYANIYSYGTFTCIRYVYFIPDTNYFICNWFANTWRFFISWYLYLEISKSDPIVIKSKSRLLFHEIFNIYVLSSSTEHHPCSVSGSLPEILLKVMLLVTWNITKRNITIFVAQKSIFVLMRMIFYLNCSSTWRCSK